MQICFLHLQQDKIFRHYSVSLAGMYTQMRIWISQRPFGSIGWPVYSPDFWAWTLIGLSYRAFTGHDSVSLTLQISNSISLGTSQVRREHYVLNNLGFSKRLPVQYSHFKNENLIPNVLARMIWLVFPYIHSFFKFLMSTKKDHDIVILTLHFTSLLFQSTNEESLWIIL